MGKGSELLAGRYEIVGQLPASGQARVQRAVDQLHGEQVVLKQVTPSQLDSLRDEFCLLSRLRHPNLVKVKELCRLTETETLLVQSFAPGPDIVSYCRGHDTLEKTLLVIAATCRGLQFIHHCGVVHRDIKPEHIRVGEGLIGSLPAVRLIDFGLATNAPTETIVGTLGYIAPEVLEGQPPGPAADLFSLGVVLFEALYGYRPPSVELAADLRSMVERADPANKVKPILRDLLASLLDPAPEHRPSIREVTEALSQLLERDVSLRPEELAGPYLPPAPLLSRTDALCDLDRLIARAGDGQNLVLHLRGCGKSAIVGEACLRAQLAGFEVIATSSPRSLFRCLAEASRPAGAHRDSLDLEQSPSPITTRAATQLVDAIVARDKPLLIALDHCGDEIPLVVALARQLVSSVAQSGCLLLLASDHLTELPDAGSIELSPLRRQQTHELMCSLLYPIELPIWVEQVHEATGGDPRLIVELTRAQLEAGGSETLLRPENDSVSRSQLLADRFKTLSKNERSLLGVICQSPVPISFGQLAAAAAIDSKRELLELTASLTRRGFVIQNAVGIGPASLAVRRNGEKLLSRNRRRDIHRRFVATLRQQPRCDPVVLALHLLKAAHVDEGTDLLIAATAAPPETLELAARLLQKSDPRWPGLVRRLAKLARARGENARALRQADRLARVDAVQGRLLRAEVLLESGQPAKAMAALSNEAQTTAAGHLLVAKAAFYQGDYDQVTRATEAGRAAPGSTTGAQLDNLSGLALVCEGNAQQGLTFLQRAEQTARQLDTDESRETLLRVLNSKGMAYQRLGRSAEAARCYRQCLVVARQLGDLALAAACTLNLGTLAQDGLQLDDALQHYRHATRLCRRAGSAAMEAAASSNEANLLLLFGAIDEAAERLSVAETAAQAAGAVTERGFVHLYRAEMLLMKDSPSEAIEQIEQAKAYFDPTDNGAHHARLLALEAGLRLADVAADRVFDDALSSELPDPPEGWRVNLIAARALLANEAYDWTRVRQQLELAVARAAASGVGPLAWEATALLVGCAASAKDVADVTFYRQRLSEQLDALRRAIPLPYRSRFDERQDVREARQIIDETGSIERDDEPSTESYRRMLAINRELGAQQPLGSLLERILEGALELTGAERGFVLLYGDLNGASNSTKLDVVASRNLDGEAVRSGADKFSRRIIEKVVASDRTLIASDALDDPRFRDRLSVTGLRLRSVLCAPLRLGHRRGALYVDNRFRAGAFGPAHAQQIEAFADQAAIAIESARLLDETRQQRAELTRAKAEVEQLNRELAAKVALQDAELTRVSVRLRSHEEELVLRYNAAQIIGRSKVMREVFFQIDRLADAEVSVFICGESGTGKELVARAIHQRGNRQAEPFVSINCGAVPASLLESELFGHARGAFTGATRDRPGLLEAAGHGTLFLDEVGDMPQEMQVKLLRVLQEGTFRRVGLDKEQQAHCRVLSASHRRLEELVQNGQFREDLYYRLQVVRIDLPPLRERREDIPLLIEHLLSKGDAKTTVSAEALAALVNHDWPGNVRQLENELQRASLLCGDAGIRPVDLTVPLPSRRQRVRLTSLQEELKRYERQLVEQALQQTNGNVSEAAKVLGMHRVALHRKLRALGISRR